MTTNHRSSRKRSLDVKVGVTHNRQNAIYKNNWRSMLSTRCLRKSCRLAIGLPLPARQQVRPAKKQPRRRRPPSKPRYLPMAKPPVRTRRLVCRSMIMGVDVEHLMARVRIQVKFIWENSYPRVNHACPNFALCLPAARPRPAPLRRPRPLFHQWSLLSSPAVTSHCLPRKPLF